VITSGQVRYHDDLAGLLTPVDQLRPHPDNPSSGDADEIATSIEVVGMYRPVYAQRSTGFILAGNTTYAACLSLGATEIPVVWLEVSDEVALRILLGDNELARLAIVDQGLLQPLLDTLAATELQLAATGYVLPPPLPEPVEPVLTYTVTVTLTADQAASWFDVPGETDRDRLDFLLSLR